MECYVLASDFKRDKGCNEYKAYHDNELCPLARALRRLTGKEVETFIDHSLIEGVKYKHKDFTFGDYQMYYLRAEKNEFADSQLIYFDLILD